MQFHEFIGKVQARAKLPSEASALKITRATLETLGERLLDEHAHQLASQLPSELGHHLEDRGQASFGFDEFITRVSLKENSEPPAATYHARVVLETLRDAVTPQNFEKLRGRLPKELQPLLAGSGGKISKSA